MNHWHHLTGMVRVRALDKPGRVHRAPREPRQAGPMGLTPGQVAVLEAVLQTKSNRGAADKLGLSLRTVEEHLYRAQQRLGAVSPLDALLMWDRRQRTEGQSQP